MMETRVHRLDNSEEEINKLLLQINQLQEIEHKLIRGNELVAVILPGKALEEMESELTGSHSLTQEDSVTDHFKSIIVKKNQQIEKLETAYKHLLLTSAAAIVPQQSYAYGHNERIAIFSSEIARECQCTEKEIADIRMAALLHDVGEIIIPVYLLEKSTTLSIDDWDVIKDHPLVGAEFVRNLSGMENVASIIQSHHEKYDGSGYPKGIKGEEIPLGARILCIVDAYDAMTNCRNNRKPKVHLDAVSELKAMSGTKYDPELVKIFINSF